jgi:aspartyl-tRNA(Asn)/glutamyl-tRNA(Gln) amidotransferase subunit B
VEIEAEGKRKHIGITRIHMEEDAGKLIHDDNGPLSYIDLNRTGTPLVEIVSEPDIRSSEEAVAYLKKIHALVRYLDICDGNMQEGSFRCDANISLRPLGEKKMGTRTELKNMNSFRNVQAAMEYEIRRQRDILLDGGNIVQETRLWNPDTNRTESMRGKEDAHDYRYFPCPDLIPIEIDQERKERFITDLGLPEYDAQILTGTRALADYFEGALKVCPSAKKISNWIMTELLREIKGDVGLFISSCNVSPQSLGELIDLLEKGKISGKIAKTVFQKMMETGKQPLVIVKEDNLVQVSDEKELLAMVKEIVVANPTQADDFRGGKTKLMGFFVGQLMKKTQGKANPKLANDLFLQELAKK